MSWLPPPGDAVTGDTTFAGSFLGNAANDHFYTLHMDEDAVACADQGRMWISTCGSQYDTWLQLYEWDDSMGTPIYSCDDCGDCGVQTVMNVPSGLTAGADYVLLVEGFSSSNGKYTLSVSCATPTSMPTAVPSITTIPSPVPTYRPTPVPLISTILSAVPTSAPTPLPSVSVEPTGSALVTDFSELRSAIDGNVGHVMIGAPSIAFATRISMVSSQTLTIASVPGTSVVLDGSGSTNFFYVSNSVVTLSGLEFRNGYGWYGGALYIETDSSVSMNSCVFIGGFAFHGAAVSAYGSSTVVSIKNSVFANNTATTGNGGALYLAYSSVTAEDSTFLSNSAGGSGGAAHCYACSLTATRTLFRGNSAVAWGGAFYIGGGDVTVKWSTIVQNYGLGGAVRNSGTFSAQDTYFSDNGRGGQDVTGDQTFYCPSTCPANSAGNCTELGNAGYADSAGNCYSCSCVLNPTTYPTPHPTTPYPTQTPATSPMPLPTTPYPTQTPATSPTPVSTMITPAPTPFSVDGQCIDCGRRLTGRALLSGYLNCC